MKQQTALQRVGYGVALAFACLWFQAPNAHAVVLTAPGFPDIPQPHITTIDWGWWFYPTELTLAPGTTTEIRAVLENRSTGAGASLSKSTGIFNENALPEGVSFEFFGPMVESVPELMIDGLILIGPGNASEFPLGLLTIAPDFAMDSFVVAGGLFLLNAPTFPPVLPPTLSPGTPFSAHLRLSNGMEGGKNSLTVTVATAPEPATLALMGLGLAGIGYQRRRKISS